MISAAGSTTAVYPTVEFRVADVCLDASTTVVLAALIRARRHRTVGKNRLVTNAVAFAPAEAVTTGAGSIVGEIMRTMAAPKLLGPPFVDGPVLVVQADAARALPNRSGQ